MLDHGLKRVKYVAPAQEALDQAARAVCQRLVLANPTLDPVGVAYGLAVFLSVLARMHAQALNRQNESVVPLDSEGQSE